MVFHEDVITYFIYHSANDLRSFQDFLFAFWMKVRFNFNLREGKIFLRKHWKV